MKSKRARACDISQKVKAAVWERDGGCCVICGRRDTAAPNAHYIRRSRGGLGIAENIVTLCAECHRRQDNGTGEQQRLYNSDSGIGSIKVKGRYEVAYYLSVWPSGGGKNITW